MSPLPTGLGVKGDGVDALGQKCLLPIVAVTAWLRLAASNMNWLLGLLSDWNEHLLHVELRIRT